MEVRIDVEPEIGSEIKTDVVDKLDLSIPLANQNLNREPEYYLEEKCIAIISKLAAIQKLNKNLVFDCFTFDEIIHHENRKLVWMIMFIIHSPRVMHCKKDNLRNYTCPVFKSLNIRYTQTMAMKSGVAYVLTPNLDELEQFKIINIDSDVKWLDLTLRTTDKYPIKYIKTIRIPIISPPIWVNFADRPMPNVLQFLEITTDCNCEILITGISYTDESRYEYESSESCLDFRDYGFRISSDF